VKRGDAFLGDIITSFKNKNITADVKVDSKSNVSNAFAVHSVGCRFCYVLSLYCFWFLFVSILIAQIRSYGLDVLCSC
jgi:hypothetical protein